MTKNVASAARGSAPVVEPPKRKKAVRYSQEVASRLLERLAMGERLYRITRDDDALPCYTAVYAWAKRYPAFGTALVEARRMGADARADMVLDVAEASTHATVQSDRLHVGSLKWHVERDDKLYRRDEPDLGAGRKLIIEVRDFECYVDDDGVTQVREIFPPAERGR